MCTHVYFFVEVEEDSHIYNHPLGVLRGENLQEVMIHTWLCVLSLQVL